MKKPARSPRSVVTMRSIFRLRSTAQALGFAVALAGVAASAAPSSGSAGTGVPVFMYHRIDRAVPADEIGRELTIDPATFESELRRLHDARIATITANELVDDLARGTIPARTVVLTFDDGYSDAATEVLPLLRKYGMRATFYVISSTIGTTAASALA